MSDNYLWNRSGEPDPEIARLEAILGPLRHRSGQLDYTRMPAPEPARAQFWSPRRRLLSLAAAAVIVVSTGLFVRSRTTPDAAPGSWLATSLEGTPTLGAGPLHGEARTTVDEWIETDASSSVRLSAGGVGMIDVGPGTRVRVVKARPGDHRLVLARGSLHAHIWAAPGRFAVDTPSATALDLGCSYTLEVDGAGKGRLRVTSGWVGLDHQGAESLVPQGATCALRPGRGPGTPYFDDAPRGLIEAVALIDGGAPGTVAVAVESAAAAARPRDAFTLWHLLSRVDRERAALVYDRLALLSPPPSASTRKRVLAQDHAALDAWWDSLGLGSSRLFRIWRGRPAI